MKIEYEASFNESHPAADQLRESAVSVAMYVYNIAKPEIRREDGKVVVYGKGHPTLDVIIRQHIADVLRVTGGNKTKAASLLGIKRTTLLAKMKRLGMV